MIFLRHPPASVAAGICYGRLDLSPGPEAEAEIARALSLLPRATALRSSPAGRCRVLADRIAARDGVPAIIDERLHELDFGRWEGRRWDAIDRAESDPWAADPWTVAPPGGETFAALSARVAAALAEMAPGTVVVTHAGVIRAARMILAGESCDAVFAAPVAHCTPIRIAPRACGGAEQDDSRRDLGTSPSARRRSGEPGERSGSVSGHHPAGQADRFTASDARRTGLHPTTARQEGTRP